MGLFTFRTKSPTVAQDAPAYAAGAQATYKETYNDFRGSVETLDKVISAISGIASMATLAVYKETTKGLQPLKTTNVDFKYNTNDQYSSSDMISMVFSSVLTQSAAFILTETNKTTKFLNFYVYDAARFIINSSENKMVNSYTYTSESGSTVDFKPEQVIHIAPRVSADNLLYTTSKLKSLTDMLTLQANIMKQTEAFYASGGKNSAIISPKESMSVEKAQGLKAAFDLFLQTPATKTLFINTEVDVTSMSNSQSATEIMAALTKINKIIAEQFGIPPYIFGDYSIAADDKTVTMACRLFFQVHMKPIFKAMEYQLTQHFRNTLKLKDAIVRFDFTDIEILEDSLSTKIEDAGKMYKLGIISLNESRVMCELPPLTDAAADYHNLPAFLVGQQPIAVERYEEAISRVFTALPSGSSGGKDNAPKIE